MAVAYSLGATLGPLIGGVLVQHLGGPGRGFQWLTTVLAFATATFAALLPLAFVGVAGVPATAEIRAPLVEPAGATGAAAAGFDREEGGCAWGDAPLLLPVSGSITDTW